MSMISPGVYVKRHREESFEQLIKTRDDLIDEIRGLEAIVFDKDNSDEAWNVCPSPSVRYQCNLEYLAALCNFMSEKYNDEYVWGNGNQSK